MRRHGSWWGSLKNFLSNFQRQPRPVPGRQPSQRPPHAAPQAPKAPRAPGVIPKAPIRTQPVGIAPEGTELVISLCASNRELLWMTYNNVSRYVEPYSYRFKSTGKLFYAFCHKDQQIESFRLDRIGDVKRTGIKFEPKYPIEIG